MRIDGVRVVFQNIRASRGALTSRPPAIAAQSLHERRSNREGTVVDCPGEYRTWILFLTLRRWLVDCLSACWSSLEAGRRFGLRRLVQDSDAARAGFGVVEGAIFALMGLLIAFTFRGLPRGSIRGGTSRGVSEAAGYRCGQAGAEPRHPVTGTDLEPGGCRLPGGPPTGDHAAAAGVERDDRHHDDPDRGDQIDPPQVIFVMLCVLALASSLLAGYSMAGGRPSGCWIHMLALQRSWR